MGEKIRKPYYITTAIAYASGKPHIGNTYEIILADAIARFKREEGYDVYFQTGTDEHGQKIEGKAKDAGMTPQARAAAGITDSLLRLSVGIEPIADLRADLAAALERAARA